MAGSVAVTYAPSQYMIGAGGAKEVIVSLTCVSDAAAGTVPSQALTGLTAYVLSKILTEPGASVPTTAYRVKIVGTTSGRKLFIGTARAVGASAIAQKEGGHEYSGEYPDIYEGITVSLIADDGATEAAVNMGNSKNLVVKLVFVKK